MGGVHITFKYRYRKQILIVSIFLILIIGLITYIILNNNEESEEIKEPLLVEKKEEKELEEKIEKIQVDIKGAINVPGIYSLDTNSRVIDVIEKAGGLRDDADTSVINLSKKLIDEMVIIIYTKQEVRDFEKVKEKEELVQEKCNQKDENALKNDACITDTNNSTNTTTSNGKVSINKATIKELMTLSGIGESKAKDIVNYRETNGPFKSIEDIKKVSGIGDSIFAKIKENITV